MIRWGIVLWICCMSVVLPAQSDTLAPFKSFSKSYKLPKRANVIKLSPFSFLWGQIPFAGELRPSYERLITHNQSVTVGFSYNYLTPLLLVGFLASGSVPFPVSIQGARIHAGYRFYPLKRVEAPEGLFFGPHVSYNFIKVKDRTANYLEYFITYFNVSMMVGYQFEFDEHWMLEAYTGIGYRYNQGDLTNYAQRTRKVERIGGPVKFNLGVNFCYAF